MYSQIDHLLPIIGYTRNQTKLHYRLPNSFAERGLKKKKKKKVPSFNHHFAVGHRLSPLYQPCFSWEPVFHCLPSCEAMLWYCSRKPNQCPPGDLALKIIPGGCNAKFPWRRCSSDHSIVLFEIYYMQFTLNLDRIFRPCRPPKSFFVFKYTAEPCLKRTNCLIDNPRPISLVKHPI